MPMKAAWWQHQVHCGRVHHYCPNGWDWHVRQIVQSLFQLHHVSILQWSLRNFTILLMAEILHQLIGSLSHYFYGFIHPRWCRISSINSNTIPCLGKTWEETIEDRIMRCQEGPVPMMHMQPSTWVRSHIDIAIIRIILYQGVYKYMSLWPGKCSKTHQNFHSHPGMMNHISHGAEEFAYKTPRPWNFM